MKFFLRKNKEHSFGLSKVSTLTNKKSNFRNAYDGELNMIMYENFKIILSFHLKQNFVMKAISQVLTEKGSRYT